MVYGGIHTKKTKVLSIVHCLSRPPPFPPPPLCILQGFEDGADHGNEVMIGKKISRTKSATVALDDPEESAVALGALGVSFLGHVVAGFEGGEERLQEPLLFGVHVLRAQ